MKKANLYYRLKPKYKSCLTEQLKAYYNLTHATIVLLKDTRDISDLTGQQISNFLILTSPIKDRFELSYMEIFYGTEHFYSDAEMDKAQDTK